MSIPSATDDDISSSFPLYEKLSDNIFQKTFHKIPNSIKKLPNYIKNVYN